ncbi:iron-containing alcohol dehydrogenase [Halosegnis longus]|uniref:Iron-containing alcohol dehydrogenase n=1 Tax=Halosegnis longus TaxID=2216012 RepID=A0AAJ4UVR8_9EURY|nr:iron-containing alcohol dehydrogenase [Salella cibi]
MVTLVEPNQRREHAHVGERESVIGEIPLVGEHVVPVVEGVEHVGDGVVLAQYGISTPGRYKASIIHAFGHGFSHDYDVHQGTIHAVVAPHVLRFVFEQVDGSRTALARAFGARTEATDDGELAEAAVAGVESVRDDLGLPSRLRDIDELREASLPSIAVEIVEDGLMDARPEGVAVDADAVEGVLRDAW